MGKVKQFRFEYTNTQSFEIKTIFIKASNLLEAVNKVGLGEDWKLSMCIEIPTIEDK